MSDKVGVQRSELPAFDPPEEVWVEAGADVADGAVEAEVYSFTADVASVLVLSDSLSLSFSSASPVAAESVSVGSLPPPLSMEGVASTSPDPAMVGDEATSSTLVLQLRPCLPLQCA